MSKEFNSIVKAWEAKLRKSQAAAKKRGLKLFFSRMSVAHVDDDDSEMFFAEKFFSNGDFYTGQWAANVGHGQGRYLWRDGCMYAGEWQKGKMMGKGKFSWPSGATYEGEFKFGYMDGKGTYMGPYGDSYRGSWVMNLRHGHGIKSYLNGDYYEGDWRRGMQDGNGRYQWKNGNNYIGEWMNGIMNGTGKMIWKNGYRFEGSWECGYPKGDGTFRWADGSFYVGFWSDDSAEQTGTYHPVGNSEDSVSDWDPQQVCYEELSDCKVRQVEEISTYPSHKVMDWNGVDGDFLRKTPINNKNSKGNGRRGSIDDRLSNCGFGLDQDGLDRKSMELNEGYRQQNFKLPPAKKQGVTISKGHKNYELMLNLQLGIRHSVGRPAPATSLDLKASAFDPKSKLWTKFPPEGSKHTPPHQSCEFKWKDYCPVVFRALRKLFKVDAADYMLSICGNDALRELSSPGKSGSFFYLTNDDKYMIKTLKKTEVKVLLRMLPAYYNHVRAFEKTLVTKFFGLHCVKLWPGQKKVRFVIMGNLFCSEYNIHRRFDLKGSTFGRTTEKPEAEVEATTTLKDLDLNYTFRLQKVWFKEFCRQVDRDCDFLEQERIMDYSLLVGIHFREASALEGITPPRTPGICTPTGCGDYDYEAPRLSRLDMDQLLLDPSRWGSIQLGINMPARVERRVRRSLEIQLVGEPTGEMYEVVLFFGIIDILQDYDISKKLEHAYKSFQYDPTSISAVDPKQYSKRFRDFVFRVFVEDT